MTAPREVDGAGRHRVHWSFWLIGAVSFLWNALGVVNYFVQMNPAMLRAYRESEQSIVQNRPAWATAVFAIAVFAGTLGSVALLFRRQEAVYLFVASLVGVIGTMIHSLNIGIEFSAGEVFGIVLMPIVVPIFLVWYSIFVTRRGWLRR